MAILTFAEAIDASAGYDLSAHAAHANYADIAALDQSLHDTYFDLAGALRNRVP